MYVRYALTTERGTFRVSKGLSELKD